MKFKVFASVAVAAFGAAVAASPASAGVIFDSQALGEPLCAMGAVCISETRGSDFNYASVLKFSANETVTNIGVFSSVNDAQNVEFLIFDSAFNGGTGDLLFSETKAYPVTSAQFLNTGPISFTFQAGHTYDVGILGDGGSLTGRWIGALNLSQGPVTEIARNANFNDFANPTTGDYSGVSPWIELSTGAVPEPATWAMMLVGFGGLGATMRGARRKQGAAVQA